MMNKIYYLVFLSFLLGACEKDINFDLKNADNVLVVDASIENNRPPQVVLTKSLNFFSTIDPSLLINSFVHDATVTMSNGITTHQLKEYAVPAGAGAFVYYYSLDTSNMATAFLGSFNTTYTLKINAESKEYKAVTTIPLLTKKPDSLWWKKAPFQENTDKVVLMIKITDPPGLGNYIRYFTKANSQPFLPGDNSVFDDQVIDGTTYQLQVEPGIDRNNPIAMDSNFFKRGDTITIKLCNIDRNTFKFWSSWEFSYRSIGNPFSQPNKVLGNISNGALGAFYGYAANYQTLIVPQ